MRRKGTAWETAHCMVPPAGVTEKPSADFQNVQVALLFGRVAADRTSPEMWTLIGRGAESEDLRVIADRNVHLVLAGLEQQGVAPGTELAGFLEGVDFFDGFLDHCSRHGRVEGEDIRTEIRLGRSGGMRQRAEVCQED